MRHFFCGFARDRNLKWVLFYPQGMNLSKTKFAHTLWSGSTAQAVNHSALVLPGIAVLPLRVISYTAVSENVVSR
jgi:hypothetical protein